ncbi:MAG: hypothetical protein ACE5IJ_05875, partial [Thermoplasmata archaeon]
MAMDASAQPTPTLEAPGYSLDNRWEYIVRGPLAGLTGFNNTTASIEVQGLTTATVLSVEAPRVTLSWVSDLSLEGSFSFSMDEEFISTTLRGTISASQEEQYEMPYFLPLDVRASSSLDFSLGMSGLSLDASTTSHVVANNTPGASFPEYPLEVGERLFDFETHVELNFTFSIPFLGIQEENRSSEDVTSVLRLT